MHDDTNDGIILQNAMLLSETTTIDWDAVLRDFAEIQALSEREKQASSHPPLPFSLKIGYNESNEIGCPPTPFSQ